MSRFYGKSKGDIPKKLYIQQKKGFSLFGPYFSKTKIPNDYVQIEYNLDENGNYIRVIPIEEVKGNKKKLDI